MSSPEFVDLEPAGEPLSCWVGAKIHGITVTDASVEYHGSITVAHRLLKAAGIRPYERVHVVNLSTGARWDTYVLPGEEGVFTLNGGGARLGVKGDKCVIMTWRWATEMQPAGVVFCTPDNRVDAVGGYAS
ncbi:aspartate 1-decarboxylase [Nonomuraea sp. NPDC050556]|uniref:aspartate 1-decarboxylase n=1 Tax=Nonomuraea sp. NPDC050556 TaxID=3364369 RepID=UPI0037B1B923